MNIKTVRLVKIVIIAMVALFATFVALGNLVDYDSNYQFVKHVLSMDDTFEGNALMWRAIINEGLITAAYWGIIITELAVGAFAWVATATLIKNFTASDELFERAKKWGYYAFLLGLALWFVGFVVIGSEWFAMWQSEVWNGKQTAMDISEVLLGMLIIYLLPTQFTSRK